MSRRSRGRARPAREGGRRRPDRATLLRAARLFLRGIGELELSADQRRTPERVADAWAGEILAGYGADPGRIVGSGFASDDEGLVVLREIPFVSVCVHHLLPFSGTAHVGYLPHGKIVGLSKIARLVDALARRLQLQERLTRQIVSELEAALAPSGVACRIEAEHQCLTIRGARKRGTRVVTTAYAGVFARRPALRAEFLRLTAPVAGRGR